MPLQLGKSAWKSFRKLLPILTNSCIPFKMRGHIFNSCVRSVMLHASETWAPTADDMRRLSRNDNAMVRWICSTRLSDRVSSEHLRNRLAICSIEDAVSWSRLRWHGHVQRMSEENWSKKILDLEVHGQTPRGRPRKRWEENVREDIKNRRLWNVNIQDRDEWRNSIKPNR